MNSSKWDPQNYKSIFLVKVPEISVYQSQLIMNINDHFFSNQNNAL